MTQLAAKSETRSKACRFKASLELPDRSAGVWIGSEDERAAEFLDLHARVRQVESRSPTFFTPPFYTSTQPSLTSTMGKSRPKPGSKYQNSGSSGGKGRGGVRGGGVIDRAGSGGGGWQDGWRPDSAVDAAPGEEEEDEDEEEDEEEEEGEERVRSKHEGIEYDDEVLDVPVAMWVSTAARRKAKRG